MINKKRILGIVFLFIIMIILGMCTQKLISKPFIKIHIVDIWGNDFEEGNKINLDFIYKTNIPTDKVIAEIYINHYNRDCFKYKHYKDLTIFDIENKQQDYWDIYIKDNLSEECFGEYELEVTVYSMGLKAKKTAKFNIVPKNSNYCNRCDIICGLEEKK